MDLQKKTSETWRGHVFLLHFLLEISSIIVSMKRFSIVGYPLTYPVRFPGFRNIDSPSFTAVGPNRAPGTGHLLADVWWFVGFILLAILWLHLWNKKSLPTKSRSRICLVGSAPSYDRNKSPVRLQSVITWVPKWVLMALVVMNLWNFGPKSLQFIESSAGWRFHDCCSILWKTGMQKSVSKLKKN